jgi:hypothetical protein
MATWTDYYSDNDRDGGSLQHLFDKSQQELSDLCLGHLEDAAAFALTISTSGGANVILLPKNKGEVSVLHQGFSTSTHLGGDLLLVFANGNLSESPFKVVNPLVVVHELPTRNSRAGSGSPTLLSMFGATTADEFSRLPPEGNTILEGRPNHILLHPRYLTAISCPRSIEAKTLAFGILGDINSVTDNNPNMSEDEARNVEEAKRDVEALLAFLWTSARGGLITSIHLTDIPESPQLNHQCELLRQKVRGGGTTLTPGGTIGVPTARTSEVAALTGAAQSLMMAMSANERVRKRERREDKEDKSLIKALGPDQQKLFSALATDDLRDPPEVGDFMKGILRLRSPHAAANQVISAMNGRVGTVSLAGLHRFFSSGFLSQEDSSAEPGGLSILLCRPKGATSGPTAFNRDKARVREYMGLDVDDETIQYILKKEYFIPQHIHDMKIQIETFQFLLELVTVRRGVITRGIRVITKAFDQFHTLIEEMFLVVDNFALKFLLTLDRAIQGFLQKLLRLREPDQARGELRGYLERKARAVLQDLEDNLPPRIIVPASLLKTASKPSRGSGRDRDDSGRGNENRDKGNPKSTREKQELSERQEKERLARLPAANPDIQKDWQIPNGKDYREFFPKDSANLDGWPRLPDPRHKAPKRMCLKFQVHGSCNQGCYLAHQPRSEMDTKDSKTVAAKFAKLYS